MRKSAPHSSPNPPRGSPPRGSPPWGFWPRATGIILLAAIVLFAVGFLSFVASLPHTRPSLPDHADGIVVLTGGSERLSEALSLLAAKKARRLLISGVHPETSESDLRIRTPGKNSLYECCIDLDRQALDTPGNAEQAALWAAKHQLSSLIVVTSSYHMPRAMLEFSQRLDGIELIPYSVSPPTIQIENWWRHPEISQLLVIEYSKYLVSQIRHIKNNFN